MKAVEFVGMVYFETSSSISTPSCRCIQHHCYRYSTNQPRKIQGSSNNKTNDWEIMENYGFHSKRINNICKRGPNIHHKKTFCKLLFQRRNHNGLKMILSNKIRKLGYHDQLSTLCLMSFMNRHKA